MGPDPAQSILNTPMDQQKLVFTEAHPRRLAEAHRCEHAVDCLSIMRLLANI
jgi:hypothetical protein